MLQPISQYLFLSKLAMNVVRLFLAFLTMLPLTGWGQELQGVIRSLSGEPVPYARVSLLAGQQGTLSNAQGFYRLSLSTGTHQLVCHHLGFASQETTLLVRGTARWDIQLVPTDVQLETVEIEGGKRDPAYAIMAQVIQEKGSFQRQFDSYRCHTYLKITRQIDSLKPALRIDTLTGDTLAPPDSLYPIDLIESRSLTHFAPPDRYKSIVQAYRHANAQRSKSIATAWDGIGQAYESDLTNPYLFYQDVSQADIDFYDNLIKVPSLGDRSFVSPLNNTMWRLVYRYRLKESFIVNGRVHYRIEVTPRQQQGPFFSGELLVVDELWALREVSLDILPATLSYFAAFHLDHRYAPDEAGRWLLQEERYTYLVKERKLHHHGETIAIHDQYEVDVDFPRNFFQQELRRTDREAFERDSSYWQGIRPVQLNDGDVAFLQEQDSLIERYSQPEYLREIDSTYNHLGIWDILLSGISFRDRVHRMNYYIDPVLEQMQWYGVGGYRHALGAYVSKTFRRGTILGVGGEIDYGFANQDLRGEGRVRYTYAPRRFARATVKGGNVYTLVTQNTSFTAIFSRSNILNKVYGGAEHRMELVNGLILDAGFEFADYRAIDELQLAEWGNVLFGDRNSPRSFGPFRQLRFDVSLTYTPGQKYYLEPYRKVIQGSKWPTFTLRYRKAVPGVAGSEINYDFLSLEAKQEFRIGSIGTSRFRAQAGRYLQANNLRFPDEVFFRGSDPFIFINPLQVFQLLDTTMNTRNAYFSGHYLHDFAGTLIDKVPLLNRLPLQTTVGGGMLIMEDAAFWHNELFAGLQYPFRIKRQRFKVGVFFVSSYSNSSNAIDSQWKVGVSWFNNARNTWSY